MAFQREQNEGPPRDMPSSTMFETILVLDFGSQYSHLIIRRLRELRIYAEMLPCTQRLSDLDFTPRGIILSGGPYSVYATDAPHADPAIFQLDVPILGICYGLQEIAWTLSNNSVVAGDKREYGDAEVTVVPQSEQKAHVGLLFEGIGDRLRVWMSHGDKLSAIPDSFIAIAATENAPFAGIAHKTKPLYGIQFHPEVTHTPRGSSLLYNFAIKICKIKANWTMGEFISREIKRIRDMVGPQGQVIGAVSGGVDSTVAAKLMNEAIGSRFHAVLVDNGVMRLNECQQVKETLSQHLGINLAVVDAGDEFLDQLKGVTDPEEKRKRIGNKFIQVFEAKATEIQAQSGDRIDFLLQGTLYPDVIESISFKGPSQTIKSHHNVGGLLANMKLKLIEPLRELFKDEVRELGTLMEIPKELVWRHPFPGPGLAIRILGEVTRDQVEIARRADHIFITELRDAGLYDETSQAFAVLLKDRSVGVMGDQRAYEQVVAIRAVKTTDFMTAEAYWFPEAFAKRLANRIVNEIKGVARVTFDATSKPPGTIEWE